MKQVLHITGRILLGIVSAVILLGIIHLCVHYGEYLLYAVGGISLLAALYLVGDGVIEAYKKAKQ